MYVLDLTLTLENGFISTDVYSVQLWTGSSHYAKTTSGKVRPVAYASRLMTNTKCRYVQIEKEHWSDLLVGIKFTVETDHKPLIPLFKLKLIDELPIRI